MHRLDLTLHDLAATQRLGRLLAADLAAGDIVALDGPLGVGKSALARAVITRLCPREINIPSPTFTLVQPYEPATGPAVMHFDLYRLESPEDALELGIEEAFIDSVCLIEWAGRLGPYLPPTALNLRIGSDLDGDDRRHVTLAGGARWRPLLARLESAMKGPV